MNEDFGEEFGAVLAPILRDLAAGHVAAPRLAPHPPHAADDEPGPDVLMLYAPDGSGCGLSLLPDTPFAEQLARVADQVQEWAVEVLWTAGESAVWPHCPEHPDAHPLQARVQQWTDGARHEDAAVWACPRTGHAVCAIGELPDGRPRPRSARRRRQAADRARRPSAGTGTGTGTGTDQGTGKNTGTP